MVLREAWIYMRKNRRHNNLSPLEQALKLLTVRPRSKWELKQLLLDRKYTKDEIEQVISSLINWGYLDDIKFIESWCYYRKHVSPKSRCFVLRELKAKGVSSSDLESCFNDFYSEEEELDCLKHLMEKKLTKKHLISSKINEKDMQKIFSALLRKGFKYNLILDIFSQLGTKHLDNFQEK